MHKMNIPNEYIAKTEDFADQVNMKLYFSIFYELEVAGIECGYFFFNFCKSK